MQVLGVRDVFQGVTLFVEYEEAANLAGQCQDVHPGFPLVVPGRFVELGLHRPEALSAAEVVGSVHRHPPPLRGVEPGYGLTPAWRTTRSQKRSIGQLSVRS